MPGWDGAPLYRLPRTSFASRYLETLETLLLSTTAQYSVPWFSHELVYRKIVHLPDFLLVNFKEGDLNAKMAKSLCAPISI